MATGTAEDLVQAEDTLIIAGMSDGSARWLAAFLAVDALIAGEVQDLC